MSAWDDLRAALSQWRDPDLRAPGAGGPAGTALAAAAEALLAEASRATAAVEAVLALLDQVTAAHNEAENNALRNGKRYGIELRRDAARDQQYGARVREASTPARAGQGPSPAEAAVKRVEALCDEADAHSGLGSPGCLLSTEVRAALAGEASS